MRVAALAFIILFALIAFTGYTIYKDYREFVDEFPNSEILFAIEHKGEIVSSFAVLNNNGTRNIQRVDIDYVKDNYPNDTEKLLEKYFKVIIVDTQAFKDMKITLDKQKINYSDVEEFLEDNTISLDGMKLDLSDMDTQEIKDYLLGAFTIKMFENPKNIIENVRDEKIKIFEETTIFKLVKDVPGTIMGPVFEKGFFNVFDKEDKEEDLKV
jgi:hypothetical protein